MSLKSILEQDYQEIRGIDDKQVERIRQYIEKSELIDLALSLGNIPSRSGQELEAANYVYDWCLREGFNPRKISMVPDRPNIVAEFGGEGLGHNIVFNAHLDTESPDFDPKQDQYKYTQETLNKPEWNSCWVDETGRLHGYPITNDRGPMSCFLIAAKALKQAGIKLEGKVYLTASCGEIGPEPIETDSTIEYLGKEIGTSFIVNHGGICPDFAVVAEGTDFGISWQACGYVLFRLTLTGNQTFTPVLDHPSEVEKYSNPIHRLGPVIEAINGWCKIYENEFGMISESGQVIPKAQIDSIRGGVPHGFGAGTELCHIYIEATLPPETLASEVERSLFSHLEHLDSHCIKLTTCVARYGHIASQRVYPLIKGVANATEKVLKKELNLAHPVYSSMWRDHNIFNMNHIPAITFGFPRQLPTVKDLEDCTLIYALIMISICGIKE